MGEKTVLPERPRRAAYGVLLAVLLATGPCAPAAAGHERPASGRGDGADPGADVPDTEHTDQAGDTGKITGRPAAPDGAQGRDAPLTGRPGARTPAWAGPLNSHPVSAGYGIPGAWQAGHHTGVDFAVPAGTPVRSVGPGRVVRAAYTGDYGYAVVVEMTDGYHTLFAHLSEISVREQEHVEAGTLLGCSGSTGRSSGPHLHFEVRHGRVYGTDVDPLDYLAARGVRLR